MTNYNYKINPICFAFHFSFVNYINRYPKSTMYKLKCNCIFRLTVATLALACDQGKGGGCKVAGLVVDLGVTSHAPGSAKSPKSVRE